MKKTMKEEVEKYVIHADLLDDNTLIECVLDDNDQVVISIRYVEGRKIIEQPIAQMSLVEYTDYFQELFQMNENRDMLAIFQKDGEDAQLTRLYDIRDHRFASLEYMDLIYKRKFPNQSMVKKLNK